MNTRSQKRSVTEIEVKKKRRKRNDDSSGESSEESEDEDFVIEESEESEELEEEEESEESEDEDIEEIEIEGGENLIQMIVDMAENKEDEKEEEGISGETKVLNEEIKTFYKKYIDSRRNELDKYKSWKGRYTNEELKRMSEELNIINKKIEEISVVKIMETGLGIKKKKELLEKFVMLQYMDPNMGEYRGLVENITKEMNKTDRDKELDERVERIKTKSDDNIRTRILESRMSDENLKIVYEKYEKTQGYGSDVNKQVEWIRSILRVPFGEYRGLPVSRENKVEEIRGYLRYVREELDRNISYLEKPKDEIINFVSKFIQNPESETVNAISIYGEAGTGKTSLVRDGIAKALNRPFITVPLGGAKDSSFLLGHGYTYEGSGCGRVIEVLKQAKCMNPIIYFDELDKVSDTPHGQEIIGVLTHLIDPSQNKEFYDNYFMGVKFDLSKVLFIFSYNNENILDTILTDRINKIKVDNPGVKEKTEICKKHLIPRKLKEIGLSEGDVIFSDETIKFIINKTKEKGCRELSRKIGTILSRLNTLYLCGSDEGIIKMKYNKIKVEFPVVLTEKIIDGLLPKEDEKNHMSMYL